jgi:uncharacterized protein YndB with AHSA1/START domain
VVHGRAGVRFVDGSKDQLTRKAVVRRGKRMIEMYVDAQEARMTTLTHRLDRNLVIQATPAIVFSFLTETPRWAAWWGGGSEIEARPGGRMRIVYPGGREATGEVLEVVAPERIVFTYGYTDGQMIPPGGSRVTITLEPLGLATRLRLTHEVADENVRNAHIQGWRYQLSLFANIATDAVNAGAAGIVDAWFEAWADADAASRKTTLSRIAVSSLSFHDRFSNTDGIDDLVAHITAAQHFMPGLRMHRHGDVRHCQGMVLADYVARSPNGHDRARGTNVFVFDAQGRIERVTGFMAM